jgi:predicted Rdx family selenoprotein
VAVEILERWAPVLEGVDLRSGTRGVFQVTVDGQVVYDKAGTGRRPRPGEIAQLLEPLLGPPLEWRKRLSD